ncbi:MAG TPA: polysaccharide deacetylase family protein [Rubrobacter sp.]|nr:polysaccharide deacetylase family protein [Rubrobacter sp.]
MDRKGGDRPIADIMRVPGPEKWQVLAEKGAPTFLLLDGGAVGGPASPARPDAEGAALAASAEAIYKGLSHAERGAWPGGVALALQMLADRSFFPPAAPPVGVRRDEGGTFRALAEGRYVRVVNFHATPRRAAGGFEEQISRLAQSFAPVSHADLMGLVARGEWPHDRPGVILNFFDGFRDNHDVAAPILDRLGLIGWFFLVSGWVSSRPQDQRAFADRHMMNLPYDESDLPENGRLALSPEEVWDLARRGHVIASHTQSHTTASPSFAPDLSPEALAREVAGSKQTLEGLAGKQVRAFAWREGTPLGAERRADEALANSGYELLFANHAVQLIPRPPAGAS